MIRCDAEATTPTPASAGLSADTHRWLDRLAALKAEATAAGAPDAPNPQPPTAEPQLPAERSRSERASRMGADLLLDSATVLDLCTPRTHGLATAADALARCIDTGGRLWLYAGSVQTYRDGLARSLRSEAAQQGQVLSETASQRLAGRILKAFAADKHWLAALAEVEDCLDAADSEAEQWVRALARFEPDRILLLTRAGTLLTRYPHCTVTPEQYLAAPRATRDMDFVDLRTQQDCIRPQLEHNLHRVLHHGRYIMGPEVAALEQRLAADVGVDHCVAVSSGTDALLVALMALDIGPGDEVITSAFSFIASAEVIALRGAVPVFVDIDPRTYTLDPNLIEARITPRTRAIMPVSLYGQCADMDAIDAIARRHGLAVIEDAAQSFGATYKGRRSCALSTIGCTSFFPSKPLGGYGDGGACFTDDDGLARAMRQIMNHGQDRRYNHPRLGINGRLDSIQAAVLLAKLAVFEDEMSRRRDLGGRYTRALLDRGAGFSGSTDIGIRVPYIEPHNTSVYAQYTVQVDDRDGIMARLRARGIPSAVHYPLPLNRQAVFTHRAPADGAPGAMASAGRVLSLPMHPYLPEFMVDEIVRTLDSAPYRADPSPAVTPARP
jgi:UDP-2-acetamido-2-deoxy-ribo-hexuluronate aminotransferase